MRWWLIIIIIFNRSAAIMSVFYLFDNDNPSTLAQRTDTLWYEAENNGRDQVYTASLETVHS